MAIQIQSSCRFVYSYQTEARDALQYRLGYKVKVDGRGNYYFGGKEGVGTLLILFANHTLKVLVQWYHWYGIFFKGKNLFTPVYFAEFFYILCAAIISSL